MSHQPLPANGQAQTLPAKWVIKHLPGEEWKPLPGYEHHYMVSNCGRVYNLKRKKFHKSSIGSKGYFKIVVVNAGKQIYYGNVHRVVARLFIGESDLFIDHIDGNKLNNAVSNLRYCTHLENCKYYRRSRANRYSSKFHGVSLNRARRKWVAQIYPRVNEREYLGIYATEIDAAVVYFNAAKKYGLPVNEQEYFGEDLAAVRNYLNNQK